VSILLALAGCSSGPGKKDTKTEKKTADEPRLNTFTDDELYSGIPEEKLTYGDDVTGKKHADSECVFPPDKDSSPILVAEWVKSRRDMIEWCIGRRTTSQNEKGGYENRGYEKVFDDPARPETRLEQAIAICLKVIDKVPDTTPVRLRLAQLCFIKGSYEYWQIDAATWSVLDLKDQGGAENEEKANGLEAKVIEPHKQRLILYQVRALQEFQAYEAKMPMSRPVDYYWKIHFQLGNWKEALRFLNETLENENLTKERRAEYEGLAKDIQDYLAEVRLNESAPKPGPERMHKNGAKPRDATRSDEGPGCAPGEGR
jgi:hypothetical protein